MVETDIPDAFRFLNEHPFHHRQTGRNEAAEMSALRIKHIERQSRATVGDTDRLSAELPYGDETHPAIDAQFFRYFVAIHYTVALSYRSHELW